ncbi:flagellar type III secretion system pore protein FliP [Rickettsiales bacterium]|nr:flagellar type III secretion system pore protein FliP [Rickettsiales bacterium]
MTKKIIFLFFCWAIGVTIAPDLSFAQSINIDMGDGSGQTTSKIIQLFAIITVLSLAPSILVMVTSFTRIVIVLSFIRTALGLQQTPPNTVLISLALFLTFFIMQPVFNESYQNGIKPLIDEKITEEQAIEPIFSPFHRFMIKNTRESDLSFFSNYASLEDIKTADDIPFRVLIPSFMISELRRAFEIGFLIFIPFLIIDMVVASTLMAMGMMMLPPVLISLPFKIVFFVLIDGWLLITSSLVQSFAQ